MSQEEKMPVDNSFDDYKPDRAEPSHFLPKNHTNFGEALLAMQKGQMVARSGWNGKGMFIFMRPADELQVGFIIDNVKSLPQSVKDFFAKMVDSAANEETAQNMRTKKVKFGAYICMYAADGSIVNGWLANQTDMLATDWCVLD